MKALFHRVSAHPLTTIGGLLIGAAELAVKAQHAGLQAGHVGNSDWISVAGGIGAIILGALAKDK